MQIEFEIPDELLQSTVKENVMRQVHAVILRVAEIKVRELQSAIEPQVEAFLKAHLTDEKLKAIVDKAAFQVIRDKLENL